MTKAPAELAVAHKKGRHGIVTANEKPPRNAAVYMINEGVSPPTI
jgi:hypothetical protein